VGSEVRRRATPAGALRRLTLAAAPDELREQQTQAVAGLMLSLSPGSFVVDSSPSPPRLLIHAVRDELGVVERSMVGRSVQR
jgi:multisubunit Na+/H+ antiporter MnhE subunit